MKIEEKLTTQLVKPEALAQMMNVSRNTILNWARSGRIPSVRVADTYRFCLIEVAKEIKLPPSMLN